MLDRNTAEMTLLKHDRTLTKILYRYCPSNVPYPTWLRSQVMINPDQMYRIGDREEMPHLHTLSEDEETVFFNKQPLEVRQIIVHRFFKREWYCRHVDYIRETEWLIPDKKLCNLILDNNYYNWLIERCRA